MAHHLTYLIEHFGYFGIVIALIGGIIGLLFLRKFGPKIHITEERVDRANKLFVGYFIPGVRHITAYLADINCYSFKKFALYAYSGAIFWCFTFITLGRGFGYNRKN